MFYEANHHPRHVDAVSIVLVETSTSPIKEQSSNYAFGPHRRVKLYMGRPRSQAPASVFHRDTPVKGPEQKCPIRCNPDRKGLTCYGALHQPAVPWIQSANRMSFVLPPIKRQTSRANPMPYERCRPLIGFHTPGGFRAASRSTVGTTANSSCLPSSQEPTPKLVAGVGF